MIIELGFVSVVSVGKKHNLEQDLSDCERFLPPSHVCVSICRDSHFGGCRWIPAGSAVLPCGRPTPWGP